MCIHAIILFIVMNRWQWCTKEIHYIKLEIAMRTHAKHNHAHVNIFSWAQKSFLCASKSLLFFYFIFILGCCKKKYIRKYTKYKGENNGLGSNYFKYGLKIYREVWKFESGILKWNICRNPPRGIDPVLLSIFRLMYPTMCLILWLSLPFSLKLISRNPDRNITSSRPHDTCLLAPVLVLIIDQSGVASEELL